MGLIKPILGDTKRNQLKGFVSAYKAGLAGRSCYRKYPCYANNMNSKRGKGATRGATRGATSREGDDLTLNTSSDNNINNGTATIVITNNSNNKTLFNATVGGEESGGSASVEERIIYDLNGNNNTSAAN